MIDLLDFEIDVFVQARPYTAIQTIPGIGPTLAAVLVAEIGDVHRPQPSG